MAEANHSITMEFLLMEFTNHHNLKTLLLVMLSAIYLVTMVGILGLVALISMECCLHTPMYIFLDNLALMDSCCSCAVTPKMLESFLLRTKGFPSKNAWHNCIFCPAETADCFLLAAMAYDCYVAICRPLQYHTLMSKKLCIQMTIGSFIASNLHSAIHIGILLGLIFCRAHHIDQFYCHIFPILKDSPILPSLLVN